MKITVTDQMHRTVEISFPPRRIVSLVPSQSELLWYLGLRKELLGISKFCIHPHEMFASVKRIGGTKKINHAAVDEINPDLIIGNKEENTPEDILTLEKKYPVWMSDINTYHQALDMIKDVGRITDKTNEADKLITEIDSQFKTLVFNKHKPDCIYLIWKNPLMAAGNHTFINDMLNRAGFKNCITDFRYPEISIDKIKELNPDVLILSTEPYPFNNTDKLEFSEKLKETKVQLANAEMFSWYGSRMKMAPEYFISLRSSL
jgi:ABC-type Fe3+-hydroxamate transport system substrate-binding protein